MEKFDHAQGNKRGSLSSNAVTAPVSLGRMMLNKVPEVTIFFWIIKIMATTVGETAADFLNDNLGLGLNEHDLYYGRTLAHRAVLPIQIEEVCTRDLLARGRADQCCRYTYHRQPSGQLWGCTGNDHDHL